MDVDIHVVWSLLLYTCRFQWAVAIIGAVHVAVTGVTGLSMFFYVFILG